MAQARQRETPTANPPIWRRTIFKNGIAALCASSLVRRAVAGGTATASGTHRPGEWMDRVMITDLIMRERWARETRNPEVAASCFHPDAWIEVSWFKGSATEFVEQGKQPPPVATVNFDSLSPPVIWAHGDRAIADASCALHTVMQLHGVEVLVVSYTRLLWRLQKVNGAWLIAGMRGVYIRDSLQATSPHRSVRLNETKLSGYRPSYRHLSYVLTEAGRPPRNDLPGVDRPDMVDALRAAEQRWVEGGG